MVIAVGLWVLISLGHQEHIVLVDVWPPHEGNVGGCLQDTWTAALEHKS